MDRTRALNLAVGCVLTSYLSKEEKREVVEALREMKNELEALDEENEEEATPHEAE